MKHDALCYAGAIRRGQAVSVFSCGPAAPGACHALAKRRRPGRVAHASRVLVLVSHRNELFPSGGATRKGRDGGTPSPAHETCALPRPPRRRMVTSVIATGRRSAGGEILRHLSFTRGPGRREVLLARLLQRFDRAGAGPGRLCGALALVLGRVTQEVSLQPGSRRVPRELCGFLVSARECCAGFSRGSLCALGPGSLRPAGISSWSARSGAMAARAGWR